MKAYTKDIIKTIVKGKKRFMALALIAALGVCMFSGIKAACDDLRYSADKFFDQQNLFDIQIVSTMGLTDTDVEVLAQMAGIDDVEGSYSEDVFIQVDGKTKQATVNVLSDKGINMPYLLEGDMPMRSDEILVTQKYILETGAQIGDTIVIEENIENEEESDEEEEEEEEEDSPFELDLKKIYEEEQTEEEEEKDVEVEVEEEEEEPNFLVTNYTIVGVAIDVADINSQEGAVAFRANNSTDYTFFVLPEAVSSDIYTAVYITLTGADELECYSDDYVARVDEIIAILEAEVKADREQARYQEVQNEANEKVDDAEEEMNDKFADAETDIIDAKYDLEDGWSELLDGASELLEGEADIAKAERQLAKAQRELERAERELDRAKTELDAAQTELELGEMLVEEGGKILDETVVQLATMEKELENLEKELDNAEKELDKTKEAIPEQFESMRDAAKFEIMFLETTIEQKETEISALEVEIETLENQKELLGERWTEEQETQLSETKAELKRAQASLDSYNKQLERAQASLDDIDRQEEEAYQEVENSRQELANSRQELAESRQELAERRKELEKNQEELEDTKKELEDGRVQLEEGLAEYEEGKQEVENGWNELEDGWDELEEAYADKLDGETKLEKGQAEFEDGKQKYEDSVSEYEDKKAEALDKIAEARQEIADLKMTEWYINDRTTLSGYSNIKTDAQCIEAIGDAFPILFMVVAILISLTTISRMVEEDRSLIGTYKALGFTDKEIRRKYIIYALLACVVGGILGDFLGFVVLPEVTFIVFGVMYQLPQYILIFNWFYGIVGILLFIVGIVGAAFVSCTSALTIMPAMLMRPKAPQNGSRVLLERVTPVWSRLSFLNKVTARNLFRYKKRLFMTLFGIAGCTSILLGGFTIKDTVTELLPLQYETTFSYDVMVVSDDNEELMEYLDDGQVRAYINPMISNITVITEDGGEESVQIIVVPDDASLRGYVNLYDTDKNKLTLEDGMIVSTINVANVLGYTEGDVVTLQTMDLASMDVEITDIALNYIGNYIYMTETTYSELFDNYEANGAFVLLNKNVADHEAYVEELAAKDGILMAISIQGFEENFDSIFRIINLVVTIVIVLAAALAFVVLFTLSTTNISERERELATIKVLGFFDKEVHLYVNKETLILTTLGILLGMPLGKGFGIWLMSVLNMPSIYFADHLYPISYLYAAVIAICFAFIVNFITDKSLDKIDPVEALKSIE